MSVRILLAILVLAMGAAAERPQRPAGAGKRLGSQKSPVERWNLMPAEDRARALEKLSPERRRRIEIQIERFNKLSPEERERLGKGLAQFRKLPAGKQARVREVFKEMAALSPERRRLLRTEAANLRTLSEAERHARLESEAFRHKFEPSEQKMLRELSGNLSGSTP